MIGYVYFVQEGTDGPIKIGWTKVEPLKRLAALENGNSNPLKLLGALVDHPDSEKTWHNRFSACRKHREWFYPTDALVAAIRIALSSHETPASRVVPFATPVTADDLRVWIKKNRKSVAAFARELGYSPSYLGEYLRGGWVRMNPRLANRIETVTGGALSAFGLLRGAVWTTSSTDQLLAEAEAAA